MEKGFIEHFEEKQNLAGEQFLISCTEVTEQLVQMYNKNSSFISLWCPILTFRNVVDNSLRSMVIFNRTSDS
ncbi:MAG: hypothetical protein ACYC2U_02595 [Candidatus Amoebophilus sp.]